MTLAFALVCHVPGRPVCVCAHVLIVFSRLKITDLKTCHTYSCVHSLALPPPTPNPPRVDDTFFKRDFLMLADDERVSIKKINKECWWWENARKKYKAIGV